MTDAKTIIMDTGRLPRSVVWGVIAICIAPWLLNALGVDFGVGSYGGPPLGDLKGLALTDALHQALAGSFVHALLEWTAFALAIFTVALAFAHFSVHRDVATLIIGLALFLAGSVDAFHTLAATRLIPAVADNARFIPFTWAISRTFHAVIAMVGVTIFLVRGKQEFQCSPRFLLIISIAFVLSAYLTIQLTATSPNLPVTEFPDSFIKRPYDVPALILFLVAGVFLFPRFLAQRQSVFAHALLIGVIPEVTTQLHMVFQSQALFDNSFNIAHFLKVIAYAVPFTGLALDYMRSHRERQRLDMELQHSTERLDLARSTETRLQKMFDDAPIMYLVVSMLEGAPIVTDCNQQFLSSLGYQREEIVGKGLDQFYDEPSQRALAVRYEAGFPDEGTFQAEERGLLCSDGRTLRVFAWLTPIFDDRGRATGGRLMYTDLSAQTRAEAEATKVAGELRQLIETANAPIFGVDLAGSVDEWNNMTATLSGYTKDEVVGRKLVEFVAAKAQESVAQVLTRALAGEETANYEFPLITKDGARLEILLNATTRRDLDGNITGVVGVGQDITERKLAEADARLKDQAIASALSPIALAEPGGPITYANQAFLSLFGYEHLEDVIGKTDFDFVPDHAAVHRIHKIVAEHGSWHGRLEVQRQDGRRLIGDISINMVLDDSGEPVSRLTSFVDVTEREQALTELSTERALLVRRVTERTADLSAANAELSRTSRAKDEFLASMSHELRTPLNAILASSEALQEEVYGPITAQQRESLELVEQSGRHLLSLINDILDLSKVEAGKLELEMDLVDVREICEASMRFVKETAHNKRLKVTTSIDHQVTSVNADGRRLKQILVNLLTNAVKFTPEGGRVGLEVVGDADQEVVRLSVWDTGIGIPEEHMTHLFQPFVQLDTGLDRRYEGTGLGLALVSRMVELHGGSITVESDGVGQGSRFTVALPWGRSAVPAVEPVEVEPVETDAARAPARSALVVEDSPSAAELLERYLNEMKVSCTVLDRGEKVLEVATATRPDVILLDLLLPDESGWQVLARLKADPQTRDIPVVIVSVVDERVRGLELGAREYLLKPYTRDELQAALHVSAAEGDTSMPTTALVVSAEQESEDAPLILIADDNETNIRSISGYLVAKGFRLAVARNGEEAVDQTRELRPDLILMDIQMPGVSGLEAIRQLREDPEFSSIPIIALTALTMPGDRERMLEAGANEYMSKPVSLRLLVETMDSLLARAGE